jgi:hypothetical protein
MLVGVLLLIETLEYFGLVPENLSILNRVLVSIEESFNRDDVVAKGMMAGFYFSSVNLTETALLGESIPFGERQSFTGLYLMVPSFI